MIRGLYAAATGMINQSKRMEAVANNIANAGTNGYKKDKVVTASFEDQLLLRMGGNQNPPIKSMGPYNHGVYVDHIVTSHVQGGLENTGDFFNLAIEGQGFFVLETDNGIAYTRDGAFTVDADGFLSTSAGWRVLGENGPIRVMDQEFTVDSSGSVYLDGAYMEDGQITAGQVFVDRLMLVDFQDPGLLEKAGGNLYLNTSQQPQTPFTGKVLQRYLEGSNVDLMNEMVGMIEASRNYESNQRLIQMMDQILGKTVNEIGRV